MHGDVMDISAAQAFWHTLARAFLPPMNDAVAGAFVELLAGDLQELCDELGLPVQDDLARLHERAAPLQAPGALLLEYSRNFLPPAGVATLNLSRLVDSSAGGACMDALEAAYRHYGLEPTEHLHDFADHAARQFDCLGHLVASDDGRAAEFARLCLVGALPRLAGMLARAAPASPYTALAALAAQAVQCYRQPADERAPDKPNRRHDLGAGVWRNCAVCARPFAREKEIAIMSSALQRAGLPADHLAVCPDCRDSTQGYFRREIG